MSEEQPKGITVTVPGQTNTRARHPEGQLIEVKDGHLYVKASKLHDDVVAVYAPGKWSHAVRNPQ